MQSLRLLFTLYITATQSQMSPLPSVAFGFPKLYVAVPSSEGLAGAWQVELGQQGTIVLTPTGQIYVLKQGR